jgi:hypothetical protein
MSASARRRMGPEAPAAASSPAGSGTRWQSCALSCRSRGTGAASSARRGRRLHCARDRRGTGGQRDAGASQAPTACRDKLTGRQRHALAELRIVVSVARDGRCQLCTPWAPAALRTRSTGHGRATGCWRQPGADGAWLAPNRRGVASASHVRVARTTPWTGNAACLLRAATLLLPSVLLVARARADAAPPPPHPLDSLVSFSTYRQSLVSLPEVRAVFVVCALYVVCERACAFLHL